MHKIARRLWRLLHVSHSGSFIPRRSGIWTDVGSAKGVSCVYGIVRVTTQRHCQRNSILLMWSKFVNCNHRSFVRSLLHFLLPLLLSFNFFICSFIAVVSMSVAFAHDALTRASIFESFFNFTEGFTFRSYEWCSAMAPVCLRCQLWRSDRQTTQRIEHEILNRKKICDDVSHIARKKRKKLFLWVAVDVHWDEWVFFSAIKKIIGTRSRMRMPVSRHGKLLNDKCIRNGRQRRKTNLEENYISVEVVARMITFCHGNSRANIVYPRLRAVTIHVNKQFMKLRRNVIASDPEINSFICCWQHEQSQTIWLN